MKAYAEPAFWTEAKHNWNLVCNGGLLVGAWRWRTKSRPSPRKSAPPPARRSKHGLSGFDPDGGWEEGPTYWNYGTRYLSVALLSLQNTYGTMFGMEAAPGLARTGEFPHRRDRADGTNFNFADSTEATGDSPQMFALAGLFNRPEYAAFEANRSRTDPTVFDLLWYQPGDRDRARRDPTRSAVSRRGGRHDALRME